MSVANSNWIIRWPKNPMQLSAYRPNPEQIKNKMGRKEETRRRRRRKKVITILEFISHRFSFWLNRIKCRRQMFGASLENVDKVTKKPKIEKLSDPWTQRHLVFNKLFLVDFQITVIHYCVYLSIPAFLLFEQ